MIDEVKALRLALDKLEEKLMASPVTDPGFGEVHALYWELTHELIRVADKQIEAITQGLHAKGKEIREEWESSKAVFKPWVEFLRPVVDAVGLLLSLNGLPNPLVFLV